VSIGHDPAVVSLRSRWLDPLVAGLAALLLGAAFSWVPSYWSDEATTLQVARLPLGELLAFVHQRDAVHTAYYLVMHFWVGAFGEAEVATRFPSAVFVGAGAAGVLVLTRMLTTRRTALLAAAIFAVLPRFTLEAAEARPYALSAALAVWVTVLLLVASRRHRRRWWIGYGAVLAGSIATFVPLGLIIVVHGVFLLLAPAQRRRRGARHRLLGWSVSTGAALFVTSPVIGTVLAERSRLLGVADPSTGADVTWWTVLVDPWFVTGLAFAVVSAVLLILLGTRLRDRSRTPGSVVLLGALWVALPAGLLLALGLVLSPVYTSRLVTFAAPGMSLLLAVAVTGFRRRWISIALVALLVAASVPTYVLQRLPTGKGAAATSPSSPATSRARPARVTRSCSTRPAPCRRDPARRSTPTRSASPGSTTSPTCGRGYRRARTRTSPCASTTKTTPSSWPTGCRRSTACGSPGSRSTSSARPTCASCATKGTRSGRSTAPDAASSTSSCDRRPDPQRRSSRVQHLTPPPPRSSSERSTPIGL
jgi:mannosyltransferase